MTDSVVVDNSCDNVNSIEKPVKPVKPTSINEERDVIDKPVKLVVITITTFFREIKAKAFESYDVSRQRIKQKIAKSTIRT